MYLRKYCQADCQEIITLFQETVYKVNSQDYTKAQCDAWTSGCQDLTRWHRTLQKHDSVVVIEDEKIIGFGDIDETGYLDHLYIHHEYQRQKVATLICNYLERHVSKITTHASITARPFFEKRGYQVAYQQQICKAGQWMSNYVMIKTRKEDDDHEK